MAGHYKVTGQCNGILPKDDPNYCPAQCCFILDYQPHGPWRCPNLGNDLLCDLQKQGKKPSHCAVFPDDDTIDLLNTALLGELEKDSWNLTKMWPKCGYKLERLD